MAAPIRLDSVSLSNAAGLVMLPFFPRNSVRSPVKLLIFVFTSEKTILPGKSVLNGFLENRAPVLGSISVTTCIPVLERRSPKTCSM